MRKSYILNAYLILFILFISGGLFSCSSTKKTKYFQDIPDSGMLKKIAAAEYIEPKVQVDDIISVIVQTIDPSASQMINAGNVPISGAVPSGNGNSTLNQLMGSGNQSQITSGYLVNKQGTIDVPVLGKINVLGYSTTELTAIIRDLAAKYYNNPTVIVRFANFKVSILGEVAKPGVYIMPNEKVSVLDALSMAGDLTIFGTRNNVLLIRGNPDGTKTPYRINLKNSNIMSEPYYYLRQNDMIYVEPNRAKAAATDAAQARNYTIIGSILSIIAIYITRK
ncbi:polysaccharide export outer membrane protein [Mucilaginibacter oryzae]|uniref:Polysaccharide export outer membrane protein n=1 Tax=Mucilaginibacter oryzae TaxID=468058 RepID=A0A316HCI7_9SPHI|nr:polysaccharide biosynthesis/export family protein [Mucilaginibacter oryzae]PWK77721.1 polysaccharide export outer membrane protein [Mucilaginibacter oryzae]